MKSVAAVLYLLLALSGSISASSSSLPNHWSDYFRHKLEESRVYTQQTNRAAVCEAVAPASFTCQSAKHTTGGTHSYVHVCPDSGDPTNVCYNSKLRRCCPGEITTSCVSKTKLRVANQVVEVEIHTDSSGKTCIAFGATHANVITKCCSIVDNGLGDCEEPSPNPPHCIPKRDVFFVLDATQSIGDDIFCRFGYVLQLIEDAIRPQGINGARVATVLFENTLVTDARADYLFNLDDSCSEVVSTKIPRVVYEYYAVHNSLPHGTLEYPQVDSRSTTPYSALAKVERDIDTTRPTSVVILTDGKPQQNIPATGIIDRIAKKAHVIIAAGIGSKNDIDEAVLRQLTNNPADVVYESNTANVTGFAIGIVDIMRRTGALCSSEANDILTKLKGRDNIIGAYGTMEDYCKNCMWRLTPDPSCASEFPTCGVQIQGLSNNLWLKPETNADKVLATELERQLLEQEIVAEIEELMGKISRG